MADNLSELKILLQDRESIKNSIRGKRAYANNCTLEADALQIHLDRTEDRIKALLEEDQFFEVN